MNGAMADPPPTTIKIPTNSKTIIIGKSQNFFLSLKKNQISFNKSICYDKY